MGRYDDPNSATSSFSILSHEEQELERREQEARAEAQKRLMEDGSADGHRELAGLMMNCDTLHMAPSLAYHVKQAVDFGERVAPDLVFQIAVSLLDQRAEFLAQGPARRRQRHHDARRVTV